MSDLPLSMHTEALPIMLSGSSYSLSEILTIAKIHPFYNSSVQYPPDVHSVLQEVRDDAAESAVGIADLQAQPLLRKTNLYSTIQRLINDTSPQNSFCRGVYTSITGGGTSGNPLFFATDVHENRKHRAIFGLFLRSLGLVKATDCVVTTHTGGWLYRSLDLTLELLENAGATVLSAGVFMKPAEVVQLIRQYNANVLSSDSSQIVQFTHYVSTLTQEERAKIKLDKIIYTSEKLTASQRGHIVAVLGPIEICSIIGSAEAGPYAVSCPHLTGTEPAATYQDFIFDMRQALIEILPFDATDRGDSFPSPVPQGDKGIVTLTSLTRRRHPLVRYITGDVGSLHELPERAKCQVSENDRRYLNVLRLQGRDSRFSFEWSGEYFEFSHLESLLNMAEYGVLQWQVVLSKLENSPEALLEIRLLCADRNASMASKEELQEVVTEFFRVHSWNEHQFRIHFLDSVDDFVRSITGRKIMKYVNRFS